MRPGYVRTDSSQRLKMLLKKHPLRPDNTPVTPCIGNEIRLRLCVPMPTLPDARRALLPVMDPFRTSTMTTTVANKEIPFGDATEAARKTLRMLASKRVAPTPDNYRQFYF